MKKIAAIAVGATAALLFLPATAAMAEASTVNTDLAATSQSAQQLGAIKDVTVTQTTRAGVGKVYKIDAKVTGATAGQTVNLLGPNGTPAAGFKPFAYGGGNSITVWYTPGSAAGNYRLQIGAQQSAPFYLAALTSAPQGADLA